MEAAHPLPGARLHRVVAIQQGLQVRVAIVGSGLAGLAAAVDLVDDGHQVDLYEARPFMGGKVGSWVDEGGNHIEMGLHVFFFNYANLFALLRKVGAIDNLLPKDHTHLFVNAGGDLRIAGDAEEVIHVRHPSQPDQACEAGTLADGAIATSGTYFSKRQHQSAWVSALVDPASGQPLLDDSSYSVIAPRCALADALTKVVALSRNPHHPCLQRHGAQALIIQPS